MVTSVLLASVLATSPAGAPAAAAAPSSAPGLEELRAMSARYAPVELTADLSQLPASERRALADIIRAAQLMDTLFMRQVWSGNEALAKRLAADRSPLGRARYAELVLNKGPWSRLDHHRPFIPGVPEKPAGGSFYPADSTKAEITAWLATLAPEQRAAAEGFFTVIRRDREGKLVAVPYSREYAAELGEAARHLRAAAAATKQPSLKAFLEARAAAFLSNDYYASDVAWMRLDASIEPTIGPYEVYEDEWLNAKAAFEAFVTLRDDAETAKLARFSGELQWLEDHLPIDPSLRNPKLGALAPIRVVSSVFSSGDANRGVQTAAFNLPNDERITRELGAKRVMLKNVQQAKFERVLVPIASRALSAADQERVSFDAFFTHILMHELMHGLGPHEVVQGGERTTVRARLQDTYSGIEEAKADISGLWALQQLIDKGVVDASMERTLYVTFLASMFRSLRFGINEAHGKGIALQLNYLLDEGAYAVAADGTFSVVPEKIEAAVTKLAAELLELEGRGDRAKAVALFEKYAVVRPPVQAVLDRLGDVPVDIAPRFVTAEKLLAAGER